MISKDHLNISAALPQPCSDFSSPAVNWSQAQGDKGNLKMAGGSHSHTWESSSAQRQALERNQATAKSEKGACGKPWQVWRQKRNQEEVEIGGTTGKGRAALEPAKGSKIDTGQGQEGQQVTPPLTHQKAASTDTTCRESQQESTQKMKKNQMCCLCHSAFAWNTVDKELLEPSWRKE